MIKDLFLMAVRNLWYRKRRSFLTVVGIFIGITALVALVSLGQGLEDSVERQFQQIGSDKVFVNPAGGASQTTTSKLDEQDLIAVRNTKTVSEAAGVLFVTTTAQFNDEQGFVTVLGTPTDDTQSLIRESWALENDKGRKIKSTDTSNVVIGSSVAEDIFEKEVGLRSNLVINGEDFRVVGTFKATGDPAIDQSVVIPYDRAAELVSADEDSYDWIFARTQKGFSTEEVKQDVEKSIRDKRGVKEGNENFSVSTNEDLLESFNSILSIVRGVVIGIASISLIVGSVNIMNSVYTSVTQRTREIGVMKAIGASKRQIMAVFLFEAGIMGMIGGIIGVSIGIGLSTLASFGATSATQIQISPYIGAELIIGSILFSFLLGTVSGILPARKASKLEPAEALRYE